MQLPALINPSGPVSRQGTDYTISMIVDVLTHDVVNPSAGTELVLRLKPLFIVFFHVDIAINGTISCVMIQMTPLTMLDDIYRRTYVCGLQLQKCFVHVVLFFMENITPMYHESWWRHQKETFSTLLAICAGHSPVPGEFPPQRPVTGSFDVFFDLRLNKLLSKQSWSWWCKTLPRPLWRHSNVQRPLKWLGIRLLPQQLDRPATKRFWMILFSSPYCERSPPVTKRRANNACRKCFQEVIINMLQSVSVQRECFCSTSSNFGVRRIVFGVYESLGRSNNSLVICVMNSTTWLSSNIYIYTYGSCNI